MSTQSNAALSLVPNPNRAIDSRGVYIDLYSKPKRGVVPPEPVFVSALFTVGYHVDHAMAIVKLTWFNREEDGTRQQLVMQPGAFYRLNPEISRRAVGGCLEVSAEVLADLGFVMPGHSRPTVIGVLIDGRGSLVNS